MCAAMQLPLRTFFAATGMMFDFSEPLAALGVFLEFCQTLTGCLSHLRTSSKSCLGPQVLLQADLFGVTNHLLLVGVYVVSGT
jgi:hypothetical protein